MKAFKTIKRQPRLNVSMPDSQVAYKKKGFLYFLTWMDPEAVTATNALPQE